MTNEPSDPNLVAKIMILSPPDTAQADPRVMSLIYSFAQQLRPVVSRGSANQQAKCHFDFTGRFSSKSRNQTNPTSKKVRDGKKLKKYYSYVLKSIDPFK